MNNPINLIDPDGLNGDLPDKRVAYVPAEIEGTPFAAAYGALKPEQKAQWEAGSHTFYREYPSGAIRFGPIAKASAQMAQWKKQSDVPVTIGVVGAGPPRPEQTVDAYKTEEGYVPASRAIRWWPTSLKRR